jgi:colanic acid/amylovoran biosynthesis glycosyltransferase
MTIGYLIPEFPGQTHIFFWREAKALRELGIEVDYVSTRTPRKSLVSHSWASEAMSQTAYLYPMRPIHLPAALGQILRAGPIKWGRVLAAIIRAEGYSFSGKMRLAALAVLGARLASIARKRGWTHLHVHSCADSAHLAMFAHLFSSLPYSMTLHGPIKDYGPNQKQKWRFAKFAIVITQKLFKEVHQELAGHLPPNIVVAPMGVELRHFARREPYVAWNGGPCRVFACGRLNPCKGHDDLIRAIALLRDRGIEAHLKIAGEDDSGGPYRKQLEQLIAELHLQDRITLLGAVSENVVRSELEAAHVFALGSLHEPLGVAIMEAMAMEAPVVVTGAGGVPELVDDEANGLLVNPRNPSEMADAIAKILNDAALAARLSRAGREKVMRSFDSSISAKAIAQQLNISGAKVSQALAPVKSSA